MRDSGKTVTKKTRIVAYLKASIANVRKVAARIPAADLDKKVRNFGGQEMSERHVLFRILHHMHEHLGQSIACARVSGLVPPWSRSDS